MNPLLRRTLCTAFWLVFLVVLCVSASIAAILVWVLPDLAGTITINGHVFAVPGSAHAGHWLLATAGVLVAALAVLVLVPVSLVLGVLGAALGLAIAFSPLLLMGLLVAWLWRRSTGRPVQPGANMHGPSPSR